MPSETQMPFDNHDFSIDSASDKTAKVCAKCGQSQAGPITNICPGFVTSIITSTNQDSPKYAPNKPKDDVTKASTPKPADSKPADSKPAYTPPSADDKFNGASIVQSLKNIEKNWLVMLEIYNQQAKTARAKYDAALAQGFTDAQALYLCHQAWN